jgi:hypothetical protein
MAHPRRHPALGAMLLLVLAVPLVHCSGSDGTPSESTCFPDNDGMSGVAQPVDLTVTDTDFSRTDITTQNDSVITFTLTNKGTKPHGFEVETTSVLMGYPNLPAGCPTTASFPSDSTIDALAPGKNKTITFITPTPDNIAFPFKSTEPDDANVPGLNGSKGSQWDLM